MHSVGKINREIYKCVTTDIVTDEVIITDNQIQHIKSYHSKITPFCKESPLFIPE